MSRLFRRALSTVPTAPAGPSTTGSVPLAVRRRRAEFPDIQKPSPLTSPEKFVGANAHELPPKLEDMFQKMRLAGQYKGDEMSARRAFLKSQNQWRSRVRGYGRVNTVTQEVQVDSHMGHLKREGAPRAAPATESEWRDAVVAQKIYLPNIQIRLVRNHTPPGEAYDPWTATFRIPIGMTKTDLRSYLSAVYDLDVTFIRTDIYLGELTRVAGGRIKRKSGALKNYKRAVVGLTEPFHYPDDIEEMRAGTWGGVEAGKALAEEREEILEAEYIVKGVEDYRKKQRMKLYKGYRWRTATHDNAVSSKQLLWELLEEMCSPSETLAHSLHRRVPALTFPTGQHHSRDHEAPQGPRSRDCWRWPQRRRRRRRR